MSKNQLKINIVLDKEYDKWPMSIQQTVSLTENNEIMLNEIILKLKRKSFNDIFNTSVSYYHHQKQLYVFGFFIPNEISERDLEATYSRFTKKIPYEALEINNSELICKLKLRKKIKTKVEELIQEQQEKFGDHSSQNQRRTIKQKEKTIAEVIQKVALWRKLYTGFPSETGEVVHYELQNAAIQIGVIKKTLDDYLLQIRNGKRHGYNFHKNKDSKIGDLRSFVREKKEQDPMKK